jgi:hypothetical protein
MKLGAEPKKVVILAVLLVVAAVVLYLNFFSGSPSPQRSRPARSASDSGASGTSGAAAGRSRRSQVAVRARETDPSINQRLQGFRPVFKSSRSDEQLDPTKVDPTLRLDLLARLQEIDPKAAARNLFQFGQAPRPAAPEPKIIPKPVKPVQTPESIAAAREAAKPKAPPIPLKFYGYVNPSDPSNKRAFFLDGEEIRIAQEGDVIKKRYEVLQIDSKEATLKDRQFDSEQKLPLVPEAKS